MVLLTFNIINNSTPLDDGTEISDMERIEITAKNTASILRSLELHNTKATFFVEISIAESLRNVLNEVKKKGHEVGLYNKDSSPDEIDLVKKKGEEFLEKQIKGFRRKDSKIPVTELKVMEFSYISNIENANILFPLKRLQRSTEIIEKEGINIVPESISPYSQIPYNDFTFQTIPLSMYRNMVFETVKAEEFVLIYLNTWQFTDLDKYPFEMPFLRKINSGKKMEDKLDDFLKWLNEKELPTARMKDYVL